MNSIYKHLSSQGVCAISSLYSVDEIKNWNIKIDKYLQNDQSPRRYVRADALYELGLLSEIFNDRMRDLIRHLIPDAELHHCHIYDIQGNQNTSHIHAENGRKGWHRDQECLPEFELHNPNFVSIFVYLNAVEVENGPFEIANLPPQKGLEIIANVPSYKMLGSIGYSFVFDRAYMHRASPNIAATNRRVLKLSIQPNGFTNGRLELPEFASVLPKIDNSDLLLKQLFGGDNKVIQKTKGQIKDLKFLPIPLNIAHNSKVELSYTSECIRQFRLVIEKGKSMISR